MTTSNKTERFYDLIEIGLLLVCCTVIMYVNASNFDETELKAIGEILLAFGAWKGGKRFLQK